ncbi:tetratricopeptide repeat protein, partial [Levilinea saccharolytica]
MRKLTLFIRGVAVFALAFGLLWQAALPVQADVAPPDWPPGANPAPGAEITQVRMESEKVTLTVLPKPNGAAPGSATVEAVFNLRNLGSAEEKMTVRFPLSFWNGSSDGFGRFPEIRSIEVKVNNRSVPTRRVESPNPSEYEDTPLPWAAFDVTFPPGEEVVLWVRYGCDGMGEFPNVSFRYILETGAGWQGTIGKAELEVRLPYPASQENVIFDEGVGFGGMTPGGVFTGQSIRWVFEDLEPGPQDNLNVLVTMPDAWQKVLKERETTQRSPRDGEGWGRLGKALKDVLRLRRGMRMDAAAQEMYAESVSAYEKSVELLPEDALWHYGFADLLWLRAYWSDQGIFASQYSDARRAVLELRRALEIDPKLTQALDLLQEVGLSAPDLVRWDGSRADYLILTATPTAKPTEIPIEALLASPTPPVPP